jgi:hypothetical protein
VVVVRIRCWGNGIRGRVTSKRSLGLVPLPGVQTRAASLRGDEPTMMPYSPVGAYIQSLDLGEIELEGEETWPQYIGGISSWGVGGNLSENPILNSVVPSCWVK